MALVWIHGVENAHTAEVVSPNARRGLRRQFRGSIKGNGNFTLSFFGSQHSGKDFDILRAVTLLWPQF